MSSRTIRVTVRGSFESLTDDQRAALLAAQDEHDFRNVSYPPEGHLSYDLKSRPFFTFRSSATVTDEGDIPGVTAGVEAAAAAWMRERGYSYHLTRTETVDLSQMPLGARGRRAAR